MIGLLMVGAAVAACSDGGQGEQRRAVYRTLEDCRRENRPEQCAEGTGHSAGHFYGPFFFGALAGSSRAIGSATNVSAPNTGFAPGSSGTRYGGFGSSAGSQTGGG